ncbi:isopentenyl phosphate kinase family protein [Candidatus Micrarchaeota archaeon]|nr:isopentenyl phosphate kinase family protein [Candidatus Micrarchaeota archaeon]
MQVLKFGGSVLTKKGGFMEEDSANIKSLAKMLGASWKAGIRDIILIHGAGSFGHPLVVKYGLTGKIETPEQEKGVEKTHSACVVLCNMLINALEKEGVPAVPLHPYDLGTLKNGRIEEFDSEAVEEVLKEGKLPVLHGDMMKDSELGYGVCSGDQLVSFFGKDAERIILGTNVDGVLDGSGKLIESITPGNFAEISSHFKKPEYADVTGGMEGKIREIMEIGKPAYVVNALFPERIAALLQGEDAACTRINNA